MRHGILVAVAIVSVVVLSACTQQSVQVDANNGIRINEFSADPAVSQPDDTVTYFLDIENVGGTTARCVKAEIFNLDSWYDQFGTSFSAIGSDYGLQFNRNGDNFNICYNGNAIGRAIGALTGTDINTRDRVCYGNTGGESSLNLNVQGAWGDFMISDFCTNFNNNYVKYNPELRPPLPERNRPGQSDTFSWTLRPPILPEGQRVTYRPNVRVSYAYASSAVINVPAMSKSEFNRRSNAGTGTTDLEIRNTNAEGPIKVEVTRGTSPIVVNERSYGIEPVNFLFEFQNKGDGYPLPVTGGSGDGGFIFGTAEVRGAGAYFQDCLGQQGGSMVFVDSPLAKLRSDNTAPFGCTIGIDRASWIDKPLGEISIVFDLYYIYYVDKELEVQVLGLDEPAVLPGDQIDVQFGNNRINIG